MESAAAERRAVGLARALQAGATLRRRPADSARPDRASSPSWPPTPPLAGGRHAAAATLREVLRELYPAALRAYPDPAEPTDRSRSSTRCPSPACSRHRPARPRGADAQARSSELAEAGVADAATVTEADHRAAGRDRRDTARGTG